MSESDLQAIVAAVRGHWPPICVKICARRGATASTALSVCVSASRRRTSGEFWGWWLVLEQEDHHFSYHYQVGFYNAEVGSGSTNPLPKKHQAEVERTLHHFCKLISGKLAQLECTLSPADQVTAELSVTAADLPPLSDWRGAASLLPLQPGRLNCLCRQQGGYKGIPYFSNPSFPWKTEP